jgi:putative pyruvate formate lyase activating enzyme
MHLGEEAPLIPSHTIFFAGCNLRCVYCQNWDISQNPQLGIYVGPSSLARRIDQRRREGSRNVNFVGGDPTPNLHYILKTMNLTPLNIPVVWNSNMYLSPESMQLLEGFVDLYLTDFKYGNDECARGLSGVPDYMEVVGTNHKWAREAGDMIIRHLVLPEHVECCSLPLMQWIYENLGEDMVINIMGQYRPQYQAFRRDELSRPSSPLDVKEVVDYAKDLGFINIIN